jgi:hypothetical protein
MMPESALHGWDFLPSRQHCTSTADLPVPMVLQCARTSRAAAPSTSPRFATEELRPSPLHCSTFHWQEPVSRVSFLRASSATTPSLPCPTASMPPPPTRRHRPLVVPHFVIGPHFCAQGRIVPTGAQGPRVREGGGGRPPLPPPPKLVARLPARPMPPTSPPPPTPPTAPSPPGPASPMALDAAEARVPADSVPKGMREWKRLAAYLKRWAQRGDKEGEFMVEREDEDGILVEDE